MFFFSVWPWEQFYTKTSNFGLLAQIPAYINIELQFESDLSMYVCIYSIESVKAEQVVVSMYVCITAWTIGGRGPGGKGQTHTRKDSEVDNDRTTYTTTYSGGVNRIR